jgi:hypothetical protein
MAKPTSPRRRRRTQTLPPELVTFMDAVHDGQPVQGLTARACDFPELAVPAPLSLTADEHGWYRITVVDRHTGTPSSGYVRHAWARDRTLDALGVSRSGFDLRRRS